MKTLAYRFGMSLLTATSVLLAVACDTPGKVLPDDSSKEGEEAVSQDVIETGEKVQKKGFSEPQLTASERAKILQTYPHLDPNRVVPTSLLEKTVLYYHHNLAKIDNKNYITVIDFSKHSSKTRFFIIDMKSGAVQSLHTSHGSGSDQANSGYATSFSNVSGSNASSLGFYYAAETYNGKWGRSMRLDGLSTTNSNARPRAVVVHGAEYVRESNVQAGRSWGCPALAMAHKDAVITKLMNGSVMYAGLSGQR